MMPYCTRCDIEHIAEYGKDHPWWNVRLLFVFFGNPIIVFLYSVSSIPVARSSDAIMFLVSVLLYPVTFPLYIKWIAINMSCITRCCNSTRSFDLDCFLSLYGSTSSMITAIPWSIAMLFFIVVGVGNRDNFKYFFAPLAGVVSITYVVMWIVAIKQSLTKIDSTHGDITFAKIQNKNNVLHIEIV